MIQDPGAHPYTWNIYFCILMIVLNGLILLMNTALDSTGPVPSRSEDEGKVDEKRVEMLTQILDKPLRYRSTNRLINYSLVSMGLISALLLPYNDILSCVIYVVVIITLSEIFIRKLAAQHAQAIALRLCGMQKLLMALLTPITGILVFIANIFLRIFRQKTDVTEKVFSEEEVMSMLEVAQASGELREEGKKMVGNIFEFDDELAYEIMTPRTDVFMIDITDDPEEYVDQLMELRFTRMPVCDGGSDDIIGILHIKDYLIKARESGFEQVDIRPILRKPYFVPETKKIDTLFFELQKEKQHIAILIDEYGGFSGIVTLEDIIEEIVGDIDDEYDEEDEIIEKIADDTYLVDGNVYLDDLNEELNIDLSSETSETIGGYLIDMLGEIPNDGYINQTLHVGSYDFTILSVRERRIERVRLTIGQEEKESKSGDMMKEKEGE